MRLTMKVDGGEDLQKKLTELGEMAGAVASIALYEGAKVMADAYSAADDAIQTAPFAGKRNMRLPSPEEKAALEGKTGIAKFGQDADGINTTVGMKKNAGYVMLGKSRRPIPAIANAINSGTSFMRKQPVYRKAFTGNKTRALETIVQVANMQIENIYNGNG